NLRIAERSTPLRRLPAEADLQVLGVDLCTSLHHMRRLDLLPLLQIRLPPHPSALPLLIAVDLLSLFPTLQVAPRVFAELAFRTGRSAPLQPLLLRHDDTSVETSFGARAAGKARQSQRPPDRGSREGRWGAHLSRGGPMKTVLAIALSLALP